MTIVLEADTCHADADTKSGQARFRASLMSRSEGGYQLSPKRLNMMGHASMLAVTSTLAWMARQLRSLVDAERTEKALGRSTVALLRKERQPA